MTTPDDGAEVAFYRSRRVEAARLSNLNAEAIHGWLDRLGVNNLYVEIETPLIKANGTSARKGDWIVAFDENDVVVLNEIQFRRDYVKE